MCRRLKRDVMKELPPIRRQLIELSANGKAGLVEQEQSEFAQREVELMRLKAMVEVAKLGDDESAYKEAVDALKNAYTVAFSEIARMRHQIALAKSPAVIEHTTDILEETQKVVVFVHHHDVTDSIAAGLNDYGVLMIDGRTPNDQRQEIVDQFNTDQTKRVLLLGIRAAGVGLSIRASVELFAELDWTPGVIAQCEGRCHGVGRGIEGEPLLVQHLVFDGSLDARMAKVLVEKQDIADRALDKGAAMVTASEPVLSIEIGSVLAEKSEKQEQTIVVTDTLRGHVHSGLRQLAGCDWDHARELNGVGFNKFDGAFGHSLADQSRLTDKQVVFGVRLVTKYKRQLGESYGRTLKELV